MASLIFQNGRKQLQQVARKPKLLLLQLQLQLPTTTTSTNNTQSTTTQANASQQKTTSTDKKTPASTSIRADKELKDTMSIGREISDFKNTKWGTDGKAYYPMTVTYGYSPEMQTVNISAEEVAACQGDEAKIKDLALKKIREKEQQESQKAE